MAKKQDDRAKLNIILPKSAAIYPKLNAPDTKFDEDGVFETKQRIDPESDEKGCIGKDLASWEEIRTALETLRDDMLAEKKAELAASKDPKAKAKAKSISVIDIGTPDVDDEGNENGNIVIKAKMKASGVSQRDGKRWERKPTIFDAKGKKLADAPLIYGGSTLKVAATAVPYYNAKDNAVGVTLYLEAVQIIDLVTGGGGRSAEAYGFGAEEGGYEAEDAPFDAGDAGVGEDGNF